MRTLTVGDLELEVRRSGRRNAVQITVDRGGELVITAPADCPASTMEDFVREKRFWIYTKLAEKALLEQPVGARRFVSGEGFPYLGRSYRLLLVDEQNAPLKLERGRFRLRRAAAAAGREHFIRWYRTHAQPWLERRVGLMAPRIDVRVAEVRVLDLGFRWGSCGKGTVNFHWAVILLPPRIVDYVIVHELVHLHEQHHTPEFWRRVERAMPDYERRKAWLAYRGGSHLAL
ncbi:MAG: M48 family metallopeptidase [bacterium]|nr:M48 family metallopeptidase [bacterium]